MVDGLPPEHFFASVSYSQGLCEIRLHSFVEVPHNIASQTAFWEVLHSSENQLLMGNITIAKGTGVDTLWIDYVIACNSA